MEAEARRSQIPEIGQTLEQSKRQFIDSVLEHPHEHGGVMKKDYSSSSTKTPSTHQTKTRNKSEPPPQPHLAKERAREEGQMCYASNWNDENSSTPTQQRVSQTQGGFWSTAGDAASSLIDMVNPVTQAKTTWADANESVRAFRNGEILHGLASTAHTALDVLYFVPVGSVASSGVRLGVKGVSAVGSRLGFFGGKGAANTEKMLTKNSVLGNISESQAARGTSNFAVYSAKENQILAGYNADTWGMTHLNKGDIVYGGLPGQSSYYTSEKTLFASGYNRQSLFESLQVRADPDLGYRPAVGAYEVTRSMRVPKGIVSANPTLGVGGGDQFFINNFTSTLKLTNRIELGESHEYMQIYRAYR